MANDIFTGKKCFRHPERAAMAVLHKESGNVWLCNSCWYAYDKEFNRRLRIIEDRQWGDQDWYRAAFPRRFPKKPLSDQPTLL